MSKQLSNRPKSGSSTTTRLAANETIRSVRPDYAYLVYSVLAVYGSVLLGIAVQLVRAKRTRQRLYPFGVFKAGLGRRVFRRDRIFHH